HEAIEILRATRDANAITGADWLAGVPASCEDAGGDGCSPEVRTFEFIDCSASSTACRINYDTGALAGARGFYTHEAGNETAFTRRMWVSEVTAGQEVEVT